MSSRLFPILDKRFTQEEINRLLPLFGNSQKKVADHYKKYGQSSLIDLLSSGHGGEGMQSDQQQQQLKARIFSLRGIIPQTSSIRQLKKILQQAQHIQKLREIIPSIQEDTITYLLSEGLSDENIIEFGTKFSEQDIDFMVSVVPVLKDKKTFLLYLKRGRQIVEALKTKLETNKTVVNDLVRDTIFSRAVIINLLKRGNYPYEIQNLSQQLRSFSPDPINDETILFLILSEGLDNDEIIEVAKHFTEGDLDFMVRSFPRINDKQTLLEDIVKKLHAGTMGKIKDALETRKKDLKELSQTTGLHVDEIIKLYKAGKKKQDIQKIKKMGGKQQQPKKKPKLLTPPPQPSKEQVQSVKLFLKTMKNPPLDDHTISFLISEGLDEKRILNFARDIHKHHLNEQDIQFLIQVGPGVQSKDDVIRLALALGVEPIKQLIQTSKKELETLLKKTRWSQGDIIQLFKKDKSAGEIFEMKPRHHTQQQKLKTIEEMYGCNKSLAHEILTRYQDIVRDVEEAMLQQPNKTKPVQAIFKEILSDKLMEDKNYFRRFPKNPQYDSYQDKSPLFQIVKRLLKLNEQQAAYLQRPYTDQEVKQIMTTRGNIVKGFRQYLQTNPWNTTTSTTSLTPGMVLANPPLLKKWLQQYQQYKKIKSKIKSSGPSLPI
jgi:hypothetical protein